MVSSQLQRSASGKLSIRLVCDSEKQAMGCPVAQIESMHAVVQRTSKAPCCK